MNSQTVSDAVPITRRWKTLCRKDRKGAVALFFGAALVPLMLMVGSAIDVSRMVENRQLLQDALDSAALAGAAAYTDASWQANAVQTALQNFNSADLPSWIKIVPNSLQVDARYGNDGSGQPSYNVSVSAQATINMTIMAMVVPSITATLSATAVNPLVHLNLVASDFTSVADDWNAAFAYGIKRSSDGTWAYNAIPQNPDLYQLGSNCPNSGNSRSTVDWAGNTVQYNLSPRCAGAPGSMTGLGYNTLDQMLVTSTTPIAIAFQNETAGGLASTQTYQAANGTVPDQLIDEDFPFGYTNQYMSNPGNINWFFSGLESANLPPDYFTDQLNAQKSPSIQTFFYATGSTVANSGGADNLSYPLGGTNNEPWFAPRQGWPAQDYSNVTYHWGQNCSLQVIVPGVSGNSPQTGKCFAPGGQVDPSSGTLYANDNCVQRNGLTYQYLFNDMGNLVYYNQPTISIITGDKFGYDDLNFSVQCNISGHHSVFLIK